MNKKTETINSVLNKIQVMLNAPKGQFNAFGKYKYRSCEDILSAVKPLLQDTGAHLTVSDTIELVGERYYIKATSTLTYNGESVSTTAYAREPLSKKGNDESQITGAASSYARKYSINGLLAIDDTKDADSMKPQPQVSQKDKLLKEIREKMSGLTDNFKDNDSLVDLCSELGLKEVSEIKTAGMQTLERIANQLKHYK